MSIYMVTGGSGGYGAAAANLLRSKGHTIHTAQRRPPRGHELIPEVLRFWHKCDLRELDEPVSVVQTLKADGVVLDGLVHCAAFDDDIELAVLSPVEVTRCYIANVINPLFFTYYLLRWGALRRDATVLFMLDKRVRDSMHLGMVMSKTGLREASEAFFRAHDFPEIARVYLSPEDRSRNKIAEDLFSEMVLKVLADPRGFPGIVNLGA